MVLRLTVLHGEQQKTVLRDRELCHSPFQPNPGKKGLLSQPSWLFFQGVFPSSLWSSHILAWLSSLRCADTGSHVPWGWQKATLPVPICVLSLWLLLLHSQCTAPPVAPCFAVSVVCIALRFRCGAVLLSDTLNEKAVLPGHFHPLREKQVELQVWAVTVEDDFFFHYYYYYYYNIFFPTPNPLPGVLQCGASASCWLCL